ncbi:MAG: hypothetical protein D4R84_03425 [Rhodocyclaceae bacterium]|nr:MAG: hypothetical protein D4R84_03425 [Rhodocyclaceae bacterium]
MESIQTNHPVLARALEYSQEATRMRELAQEAAAKITNPLKEQPANRVTFSQEAQTRLNEEKTHAANLVKDVRDAVRAAAADERSHAMREEHRKEVEARVEARDLRVAREMIAREKAEGANKAVADNREAIERIAKATRTIDEVASEKAIEQQSSVATEFLERRNADDFNRAIDAKAKKTNDLLEKQKGAVVVKNMEASKENIEVAIEHSKKVKTVTERAKAETEKATRMYQHIDSMG